MLLLASLFYSCANAESQTSIDNNSTTATKVSTTMKVEIWSDVMCPFCYIGKRRFEAALSQFAHRDQVEVVWKSFQLDPNLKTNPTKSVKQSLAESKGWSLEQTDQTMAYVVNMAKEVGLTYHFDKAVVANSFDAHRFSHLAKKYGKQDEAEERLFAAYFTEGKNTADHQTLNQLGSEIGLNDVEVAQVLAGNDYADDVQKDIYEARQVGVTGVPFFVFEDKYTVSGAQGSALFLQLLEKVWAEQLRLEPQK
ncbi:MAG: DsbA family oxidoreductase [Saprospiraceae bacterium]|nr:DsbA family oxidoreductase [Saprospiraceae bacterium]